MFRIKKLEKISEILTQMPHFDTEKIYRHLGKSSLFNGLPSELKNLKWDVLNPYYLNHSIQWTHFWYIREKSKTVFF